MKPLVEDTFRVLTSDLLATAYDRLIRDLETRAVQPGVIAVDFSDTRFVVLRQHDDAFAAITNGLDLLIPTSRPLIWAMKQRGSEMEDPIDASIFMRKLLLQSTSDFRHYFIGESEEGNNRLREWMLKQNPDLDVAGFFHGTCSQAGFFQPPEVHDSILEDLRAKEPHFVWVGLDSPKQYALISNLKRQLHSGILLATGVAFERNAGMRRHVPVTTRFLGANLKDSFLFFLRLLRGVSR
jgi:N-acetylglucosaminyldiphosphoundecaprenol N-acetyl-beta-D-mannosaminyltransferase